jgi:hypothetical protein
MDTLLMLAQLDGPSTIDLFPASQGFDLNPSLLQSYKINAT